MSALEENKINYAPEPENFWKESGMTLLIWLFMVLVIGGITFGCWAIF